MAELKDIAIYGAGGFGREIACLINRINENEPTWKLVGFFDDGVEKGEMVSHFGPVLGGMQELNVWQSKINVVVAIGIPSTIKKVVEKIDNVNVEFPNIIAPNVTFLEKESVLMGKGNLICSNCLISCDVKIGDFNIFNGFVPVGHDVEIGNYNVIMPSVNISGAVKIGDCNFFGVQSVVLQRLKIGNDTRIGANSVIIRNTKDGNLYMGNPAMKVKF